MEGGVRRTCMLNRYACLAAAALSCAISRAAGARKVLNERASKVLAFTRTNCGERTVLIDHTRIQHKLLAASTRLYIHSNWLTRC